MSICLKFFSCCFCESTDTAVTPFSQNEESNSSINQVFQKALEAIEMRRQLKENPSAFIDTGSPSSQFFDNHSAIPPIDLEEIGRSILPGATPEPEGDSPTETFPPSATPSLEEKTPDSPT